MKYALPILGWLLAGAASLAIGLLLGSFSSTVLGIAGIVVALLSYYIINKTHFADKMLRAHGK